MAILVDEVRAERCTVRPTPSIREVCLVGVSRARSSWRQGERVTFSGRVYRVEATRARPGREDETPRYVHLSGDEETG